MTLDSLPGDSNTIVLLMDNQVVKSNNVSFAIGSGRTQQNTDVTRKYEKSLARDVRHQSRYTISLLLTNTRWHSVMNVR